MRVRYDPSLIEQAVLEASRHDPSLETELHRAVDPLYDFEDPRMKSASFQKAYKDLFKRWHLHGVISKLLTEWPRLDRDVHLCIVREAPSPRREIAELYVRPDSDSTSGSRTLFIHICPRSLVDPQVVAARMRRELLQVCDMIDEHFGYRKKSLAGTLPRHNLIRDRYRVLWDLFAEGRLARRDHRQHNATTVHRLMRRVFPEWADDLLSAATDRVCGAEDLTHDQLLAWAARPERLFLGENRSRPQHRQAAGESCPVCGFSTHDWSDQDDLHKVEAAVRKDFPGWQPDAGICRQCTEIYGEIQMEAT